jgi:antitoxin component YwqK of YwqJK toxin-antitoxin module
MFTKTIPIILLVAIVLIAPTLGFAEMLKEYYPSGKLHFERNYENGKLEGITKEYCESGELGAEINYKNGVQDGLTKIYYDNGEIAFIDTYKNGKKINSKAYDEERKLKFDQNYPTEE